MVGLIMLVDLDDLPADPELLHRLVRDMAAAVESRDGGIERLQAIIRKLQRARFGRRSEPLDPDQLALALEDLDADICHIRKAIRWSPSPPPSGQLNASRCPITSCARMSFLISRTRCARAAGGALHAIGESLRICSTGFPRSSASSGSRSPNTPAGPMRRSFSMKRRSGRSPAGWPRPRCWRSVGLQML